MIELIIIVVAMGLAIVPDMRMRMRGTRTPKMTRPMTRSELRAIEGESNAKY
jgi:hypothetical protein